MKQTITCKDHEVLHEFQYLLRYSGRGNSNPSCNSKAWEADCIRHDRGAHLNKLLRDTNPELAGDAAAIQELTECLQRFLAPVAGRPIRDLLGCIPLRVDDVADDDAAFQFRHKTVAEWLADVWLMLVLCGVVKAHEDTGRADAAAAADAPVCLVRRVIQRVPEALDAATGSVARRMVLSAQSDAAWAETDA
eukprot:gene13046-biopygen5253